MVSKVIPSMREAHEKTGYTLKDDEIFLFLIGLENKIFYITEDYTVLMSNTNHYGIGTGAAYGLGALAAGVGIEEATKIAIKLDINSGGKIQIVQQGD
jgi:ATP-dependent protease HslVU (ClpYQ) peptidase subunit